jgi:hypothetical protein
MVHGLPLIQHIRELCDSFLAGKQRRAPFPKKASFRAGDDLELVHGDLCRPIKPTTHGGRCYFLLLVDDCSRYLWLHLLTSKDKALVVIKRPNVSFLRTFGCVRHVKKMKPNLSKLEDRNTPMVFLGYETGSKAYWLFDPWAPRVVIFWDVVFDEAMCWDLESCDEEATVGGLSSSFTIEYTVYSSAGELA